MTYAGVELGGTKCVLILARNSDDVLARETIPTTHPDETLERIERALLDWKAEHEIRALGIASFGPIELDPRSENWGHLLATPKPGWARANVAARLRDSLGLPTMLDTDVNAAALAEMRWGSGQGFQDFAYVTVGTGVGVGLIANDLPMRGFGHCELGHLRVARLPGDDWPGSCPYHGDCVEGLASGSALRARLGHRPIEEHDSVWDPVIWALAQLCHAIACAAAPRRIAMGGGVMEKQPHLLGRIQAKLEESLGGFLKLPVADYICPPGLGRDAGPLGAIALAMEARP